MNNNLLISSAMLNAFWEQNQKDTLELLVPFIKYSIAKNTAVGHELDVTKIIEFFKAEFGYESMPNNVVTLLLNRLCPDILNRQKLRYKLKVSLDSEVLHFEKGHACFEERRAKVAVALKDYLNDNFVSLGLQDENSSMQALISFFVTNGMCVIREAALLELLKNKDDALKYAIAQFIVHEYKKKSAVFSYIEDMVKGFFVSTVISLQPQNPTMPQSKFKGLKCFLDTRLILNALGLHLPDGKEAAMQLLNMLKEKGAELCCYEHTLGEIYDILDAYKMTLLNPGSSKSTHTLERFDADNYKVDDVERYQRLLRGKITFLGISIYSKPKFDNVEKFPLNEAELAKEIKQQMKYKKQEAIDVDILSVTSTLLLRDERKEQELEKTKAIFVTTNIQLVGVVNSYLKSKRICNPDAEIMPMISDIDLSSIVWLKCYSTHKDYPIQRLIEHAMIALEPTPSLLNAFFEKVDKIKAEGGITEDEAAILRVDAFCRKELAIATKGDIKAITAETIYGIRKKLREEYVGEADEEAQLNYKKYQEERQKNRRIVSNVLLDIDERKDDIYKRTHKVLKVVGCIAYAFLIVSFCALSFKAIEDSKYAFAAAILFVVDAYCFADMMSQKLRLINKLFHRISNCFATKAGDKEKVRYEKILDLEFSDIINN